MTLSRDEARNLALKLKDEGLSAREIAEKIVSQGYEISHNGVTYWLKIAKNKPIIMQTITGASQPHIPKHLQDTIEGVRSIVNAPGMTDTGRVNLIRIIIK